MSDNQRFESNHFDLHSNESQNQNNQTYDMYRDQQTEHSYHTYQVPSSYPPKPIKKKRKTGKIILLIVFCLLIGAVSVGGQYLIKKNLELQDQLEHYQKNEPVAENDGAKDEPKDDLHNKSFSLEESAKRPDRKNLSISEIVQNEKDGVVAITTNKEYRTMYGVFTGQAAGSGFIITKDGYVVTNNHVIVDADNIKVVLADGAVHDAKLVGADPLNDLAVLKMDGHGYKPVELGDSDDVKVGELAVAIGNPSGNLSGTVTAGIISALQREINVQGIDMTLMQTDAAINEGNSGGALFNSLGQVIGINSAKLSISDSGKSVFEGLGFAIPINIAKPIINDIIKYGEVQNRVALGIRGQEIGRQLYIGPNDFGGIFITEVIAGGSLSDSEVKQGDIIVKLDDQRISTVNDINNFLKSKKAGDKVKLTYVRNNELHTTDIELKNKVNTEVKTNKQSDKN